MHRALLLTIDTDYAAAHPKKLKYYGHCFLATEFMPMEQTGEREMLKMITRLINRGASAKILRIRNLISKKINKTWVVVNLNEIENDTAIRGFPFY